MGLVMDGLIADAGKVTVADLITEIRYHYTEACWSTTQADYECHLRHIRRKEQLLREKD